MRSLRSAKHALTACLLVVVTGCAMQPVAPAVTLLRPTSRVRVLELPAAVSDDALHNVLHAQEKQAPPDSLATDRRNLQQLVAEALTRALAQSSAPSLASASVTYADSVPDMTIGQPLAAADLAALQEQHPADAYLRVQVTDYGQTPGSWKSAYITFEVVTTVAIGAYLYAHKATRVLAGAYLAEEGIEEFGEGYAGSGLINRLSRPVRIEADLVDGRNGAVIWHDSETGMASWEWGHLWHMDDATRNGLLRISTDKMANDLVKELEGN